MDGLLSLFLLILGRRRTNLTVLLKDHTWRSGQGMHRPLTTSQYLHTSYQLLLLFARRRMLVISFHLEICLWTQSRYTYLYSLRICLFVFVILTKLIEIFDLKKFIFGMRLVRRLVCLFTFQPKLVLSCRPRRVERLTWPSWLVTVPT